METGNKYMYLGQLIESLEMKDEFVKEVGDDLYNNDIIPEEEIKYLNLDLIEKGLEKTEGQPIPPLSRLKMFFKHYYILRQPYVEELEHYEKVIDKATNHHTNSGEQIGFEVKTHDLEIPELNEVVEEMKDYYYNEIDNNLLKEKIKEKLKKSFEDKNSEDYIKGYLEECWRKLNEEINCAFGRAVYTTGRQNGYAIIPIEYDELIDVRRWIDDLKEGYLSPDEIHLEDIKEKVEEIEEIQAVVYTEHKNCLNNFEEYLEDKVSIAIEETIETFKEKWRVIILDCQYEKEINGFNTKEEAIDFGKTILNSTFDVEKYSE